MADLHQKRDAAQKTLSEMIQNMQIETTL